MDFGKSVGIIFDKIKLLKNIKVYDQLFKEKPISDLTGGMGYNNGLILYILFSHYQPRVSVESGVWRGFTTYLIDNAICEDSKIYCFDIRNNYSSSFYEYSVGTFDNYCYANFGAN